MTTRSPAGTSAPRVSKTRSTGPLSTTAALHAQQTFTSPYGFDTTEGNTNHDYILFKYNKMRWQQIDHTPVGTGVKVLRSIAWRRR